MMSADVIFTGGAIFTGAGEPLHGHAVAVTGGRITTVLPAENTPAYAGPTTRVVDLAGALLSPGFQDAHIHPVGAGVELLQCNLSESKSAEEAVATVAAYAAGNPVPAGTAPSDAWILGGGWTMEHFPGGAPTRGLLDAVVPDRPVVLSSRDHHSVWANTAAIRLAGLDATTPDPADGRIEREPDGLPAGTFHEGAEALFDGVRPAVDDDLLYAGFLRAQEELIALGVTGWQDAIVGDGGPVANPLRAYLRAVDEGTLRVHVDGAQWWQRHGGIEQVPGMVTLREEIVARDPRGRLRLGSTKIMVDGVAENFTAAMLASYHDCHGHATGEFGLSFIEPERLREYVTALDAAGQQVHFHALGDRAVREALDALEAARAANGPATRRHHLAHLQMVDAADVPRFAEVEAVANLQALWATHEPQIDGLTLPFLREGAEERHYPFGDLVEVGARLAAGSDWPVSSANPIEAIHVAVNRRLPESTSPVLGAEEQCLDLATALAAYTSGTAYVNHRDHETGWIRPGYVANVIVLEPDPFSVPAEDIHRVGVASTWIDGEPVFVRDIPPS